MAPLAPAAGATSTLGAASTLPSSGCSRSSSIAVTPGKTQTLNFSRGSVSGSYELTVPRNYSKHHPSPLIFLFHGDDSSAAAFTTLTNFPARASAAGDITVVPNSQPGEKGFAYTGTGTDAIFINTLLGSLKRALCVNQRAVFTSGFSSGAAFAILYACAHQDQIRAIASVSVDYQLGCTRPVPLLAFHGTHDPNVTYQNNTIVSQLPGIKLDANKVRGTLLNMKDWVKLDRCQPKGTVTRIASQVSRSQWLACAPGTSVTFYTIIGGGHDWPGANPSAGYGLTTQQISATTLILRFFNSFH